LKYLPEGMLLLVRLYQQCAAASEKQRQNWSSFFHAYIDIKGHEALLFFKRTAQEFRGELIEKKLSLAKAEIRALLPCLCCGLVSAFGCGPYSDGPGQL
jgi:hypothetical protein